MINLNNKKFKVVENSTHGEVSSATIFLYKQDKRMIWADYAGGDIIKGSLLGIMNTDQSLTFVYHHVNQKNEVLTGKCVTTITQSEDERIILNEQWQWTCGDHHKGTSILIEL